MIQFGTRSCAGGVLSLAMAIGAANLQAAPLNLVPFNPDIITNGTAVSYVFDNDGFNTLTITGLAGGNPSSQFITIPGGNSNDGGPTAIITGDNTGGPVTEGTYSLTADFDNSGAYISGTGSVTVGGYVVNPGGFFGSGTVPETYFDGTNTGTVLTMDLVNFGFSGTPTLAGDSDTLILEWSAAVIGGDLFNLGFLTGGVIAVGNVFWGTSGSYGGEWDPLAINDTTAFTQSFASCTDCALQVDTFVPIPAAVWLFGSGLLGLIGVAARRRGTQAE